MGNIRAGNASLGILGILGGITAAGLAFSAGTAGIPAASAQPAITARLGASRPLPAGFFGVNYDYGGAPVYKTGGSVDQQLAKLAPGTLRWPGGTSANYFQWQKGCPVLEGGTGCEKASGVTFPFTLADLAAASGSSGATPIFDINVMTSTLTQQIDMLKTAQNTDQLPVKYVELGNEFYLPNADYAKKFATAGVYGKAVAADVKALHQAFPGVQVAAVGSALTRSTNTPREVGWNAGMLKEATRAGKPDVITLHDHPAYKQSLTVNGLPGFFTEAYTSAAHISQVTKEFPGTPTWITEYGLSLSSPAAKTYANALFEGAAAVLLAQQVSDATLVNYWAAFGNEDTYVYTSGGLTPAGLAMTWLDKAAQDASTATQITFPGGPALSKGGDPALVGESFSGTGTHREVLINLSGSQVTITAGTAIPAGARYSQATTKAGVLPTSQIPTANQLMTTNSTIGRSLTLAPYSITQIS